MNHMTGKSKHTPLASGGGRAAVMLSALLAAGLAVAQVPVDAEGNPLATRTSQIGPADVENPNFASSDEYAAGDLEALVGPIALYPDDLLAVVLPASTYPLELVQAARFLEQRDLDPSLEPDEDWDDSVVALLNYPDVLALMNEDLDWTWQLGDAVVRQQADVVLAIETFRDRAFAAGNLSSDEHQLISRGDSGAIEIEPASDDVIYVPYYEPATVVHRSTTPVYHYYPRPYPVYNYPYPVGYNFVGGAFWGVSTAYTIGWSSNYLHVYHPSYRGHPFYGSNYSYRNAYWRRPSISVYNNWYVNPASPHYRYRHYRGDYWRPRVTRRSVQPTTRVVNQRYSQRSNAGSLATTRRTTSGITFRNRMESRESGARRNDQSTVRSTSRRDPAAITNRGDRSMPGRVVSRSSGRSASDSLRLNAGRTATADRSRRSSVDSNVASPRSRTPTTRSSGRQSTIGSGATGRQARISQSTSRNANRSSARSRQSAASTSRVRTSSAQRASRPSINRSTSRSSASRSTSRASSARSSGRSASRSASRGRSQPRSRN